jgi:HEAT repeat protein
VARIRAAFALGRLKNPAPESIARIREQLRVEPSDSIARVYLITALLLHEIDASAIAKLENQMLPYLRGKPNEQLEVGIVTGVRGNVGDIPLLQPLLHSDEPDARIGAANGLLRLIK